jgi:hypothetical protein
VGTNVSEQKAPVGYFADWGKVNGPYLQASALGVAGAHSPNTGRRTFASQ